MRSTHCKHLTSICDQQKLLISKHLLSCFNSCESPVARLSIAMQKQLEEEEEMVCAVTTYPLCSEKPHYVAAEQSQSEESEEVWASSTADSYLEECTMCTDQHCYDIKDVVNGMIQQKMKNPVPASPAAASQFIDQCKTERNLHHH